jgi:hypothetical protein
MVVCQLWVEGKGTGVGEKVDVEGVEEGCAEKVHCRIADNLSLTVQVVVDGALLLAFRRCL